MRELSQLLIELHDGLCAIQAREGVRLSSVEMTLPIVVRPVLQGGRCVLQAEFVRGTDPEAWAPVPSRLRLGWAEPDADAPAAMAHATPEHAAAEHAVAKHAVAERAS